MNTHHIFSLRRHLDMCRSEKEAQPVGKLVLCRLDLLEKEFGWRFSSARAADTGP